MSIKREKISIVQTLKKQPHRLCLKRGKNLTLFFHLALCLPLTNYSNEVTNIKWTLTRYLYNLEWSLCFGRVTLDQLMTDRPTRQTDRQIDNICLRLTLTPFTARSWRWAADASHPTSVLSLMFLLRHLAGSGLHHTTTWWQWASASHPCCCLWQWDKRRALVCCDIWHAFVKCMRDEGHSCCDMLQPLCPFKALKPGKYITGVLEMHWNLHWKRHHRWFLEMHHSTSATVAHVIQRSCTVISGRL